MTLPPHLDLFSATDPAQVAHLIANGADPNAMNDHGYPVLHWAIFQRHNRCDLFEIVAELVRKGADVNGLTASSDDWSGMVPLCFAYMSPDERLVPFLIEHGADVNLGNKTPLHLCVKVNAVRPELADETLKWADYWLYHGADPNSHAQDHGITPLFFANTRGMVERLLAAGGDPYLRNKQGMCAAQYWRERGHVDALRAIERTVCLPSTASPLAS